MNHIRREAHVDRTILNLRKLCLNDSEILRCINFRAKSFVNIKCLDDAFVSYLVQGNFSIALSIAAFAEFAYPG